MQVLFQKKLESTAPRGILLKMLLLSYANIFVDLVVTDFMGSLVWFPIWWYSAGVRWVGLASCRALRYRWASDAFNIWLKNFFVPMYGAYDIWSRLISLLMRTVVLSGRLIALGVEAAIYVLGLLVWIAAPLVFGWLAVTNVLTSA